MKSILENWVESDIGFIKKDRIRERHSYNFDSIKDDTLIRMREKLENLSYTNNVMLSNWGAFIPPHFSKPYKNELYGYWSEKECETFKSIVDDIIPDLPDFELPIIHRRTLQGYSPEIILSTLNRPSDRTERNRFNSFASICCISSITTVPP